MLRKLRVLFSTLPPPPSTAHELLLQQVVLPHVPQPPATISLPDLSHALDWKEWHEPSWGPLYTFLRKHGKSVGLEVVGGLGSGRETGAVGRTPVDASNIEEGEDARASDNFPPTTTTASHSPPPTSPIPVKRRTKKTTKASSSRGLLLRTAWVPLQGEERGEGRGFCSVHTMWQPVRFLESMGGKLVGDTGPPQREEAWRCRKESPCGAVPFCVVGLSCNVSACPYVHANPSKK